MHRKYVTSLVLVLILSTFAPIVALAQLSTGSISGTVTDPTAAVIPDAQLTLTSLDTSVVVGTFATGTSGLYHFEHLQKGSYEVRVVAKGFRDFVQRGITVDLGQSVTLDVKLELGTGLQTIEVTSNASPLNSTNAEIKQSVPTRAINDLPLQVAGSPRTAASFVALLPGVMPGGPFDTVINGGMQVGEEALMDGVSGKEGLDVSGMISIMNDSPITPEAVSEVSVLTSNYDPQYGSSTGGVIAMVTKSGTDKIHGEAHEFLRNNALNSRQYGVDNRPFDIENEFGFSIGGPAKWTHIPGFWSNKRKSFWFVNFDEWRIRGGLTHPILTLPTMQERQGDFSDWTDGSGNLIPVYDPATRTQFMGCNGTTPNVICATDRRLVNSLAQKYFQYMPPPNRPGLSGNFVAPNLFYFDATAPDHKTAWDLRFDHYEGEKDHVAAMIHYHMITPSNKTELPPQISTLIRSGNGGNQGPWLNRMNWDHSFSPSLINTFNAGYNDARGDEGCVDAAFVDQLPQIPGLQQHIHSGYFNFDDFSTIGCDEYNHGRRVIYEYSDMATKVSGKHDIKFGGGLRFHQENATNINGTAGSFNFNRLSTGLLNLESGSSIASFLLEQVGSASASYLTATTTQMRSKSIWLHVGDTWKATQKLTLNYGLRWDLSTPAVDKYDRLSFFDPSKVNEGAGGRLGALVFAGTKYGAASFGRRAPEFTYYRGFGPRLGIAYALSQKTVVRSGYGIFFIQAIYPQWNAGSSLAGLNGDFSFSSSNSGLTPAFILSQGIPQTFTKPPFIDPTFLNGQSPPIYRPFDANRLPYAQQWNLTVEHQFTENFYISAAYVGSKGTRLPSGTAPLNSLNPSLLSTMGPALFDEFASGQTSLDGVSIPYAGWVEQMSACAPTVAQALVPYPQYCGSLTGYNENAGNSTYHSFQFKAERRLSHGVWFLGSYTNSKMISDSLGPAFGNLGNLISPYQRERNKALSPDDAPQLLALSLVYELPFGHGQRFLSRTGPLDRLVGGWEVAAIFRATSGFPFLFNSRQCNVPSQFNAACLPAVIGNPFVQSPGGFDPAKGSLFNSAAFENPNNFNFYLGQGPTVSNVRGPAFQNQDFTLMKTTRLTERVGFQFRADFFNAWNWHQFLAVGLYGSAFDTDVSSPTFGQWNGTVTAPRNIQFGMKILF